MPARTRLGKLLYANRPIPASQTDEGKERLRAYRLALGEFVEQFARVEMFMHFVLRWHTKTKTAVARAVFSGVRTAEISNRLRRLFEVGFIETAEWVQLEPVLKQLGEINDARNKILHYGAESVAEGRGVVTTALMALTEAKIETFPISPVILADMTQDLRKISIHLVARHVGRPALRGKHPEMDAILQAGWRYTRPAPAKTIKVGKNRSPKKASSISAARAEIIS
jgi:hypothetical protein